MPLHLPLLMKDHVVGKRSAVTCALKCANQCLNEVCNTSDNGYFRDIATAAIRRRTLLGGAATGAVVIAASGTQGLPSATAAETVTDAVSGAPEAPNGSAMRFTPIKPVQFEVDEFNVPEGYEWHAIIRWGDALFEDSPEFDWNNQSVDAQKLQFGYNNDFTEIQEVPGEEDTHAVMFVNHEYTNAGIMFPDTMPELQQIEIQMAAQGLSVVELQREDRQSPYSPIKGAPLNRRFLTDTMYEATGPGAGSDLLKTTDDPEGRFIQGTIANCAGGLTPWGTLLTGEENFHGYFLADPAIEGNARLGLTNEEPTVYGFDKVEDRFNSTLSGYENEVNRFGYIVEVDPWDPTSTPKKHTNLGRFKHEGANVIIAEDGRAVAYSGDDERFEYMYKFVSKKKYVEGDRAHNMTLLAEGDLYVARFTGNSPAADIDGSGTLPADGAFDGSGEWLPLLVNGKSMVEGMTAAEVAVHTRLAADKVNPTKMDRPEDVEPSLHSRKVYAALTNNSNRAKDESYAPVDEANPRAINRDGHVIEIDELGDQTSTSFGWNLLLVAGDPAQGDTTYFGGFPVDQVSPISCPDNLAFDSVGNLWISTDGAPDGIGFNDGLFRVTLDGAERGKVEQFLSVPREAETCGPIVRDADMTAFVSVQHPGEDGSFAAPHSYFPDFDNTGPRPTVVQVLPVFTDENPEPTETPEPTADPTTPQTDPTTPAEPTTPADPTTPAETATAAPQPTVPAKPAPAKPAKPAGPGHGSNSSKKAQPTTPAQPAQPAQPSEGEQKQGGFLPRTGPEVLPVVAGAAALLGAGGALVRRSNATPESEDNTEDSSGSENA